MSHSREGKRKDTKEDNRNKGARTEQIIAEKELGIRVDNRLLRHPPSRSAILKKKTPSSPTPTPPHVSPESVLWVAALAKHLACFIPLIVLEMRKQRTKEVN